MKIARFAAAFVFVLQLFLPISAYAAESAAYSFTTTINVAENFSASVRTIVEVDTSKGPLPSTLSLPAYGTNLTSLNANLADNKPLTIEAREGKLSLLMSQAANSTAGLLSFEVSYTSQIVKRLGKSSLLMIPPLDYGNLSVTKESLSINSDPALGIPLVRGGKTTSSQEGVGTIAHTWSNDAGKLKEASGLLFGDNAVATLTYKSVLQNDSLWWKTQTIALPPDTNQQRVFLDSISPEPKALKLDRDGNIIAEYRLGPRQKVEISAQMNVALNNYVYKLEEGLSADAIDRVLVERYTTLNDAWKDGSFKVSTEANGDVVKTIKEAYEAAAAEKVESDDQYQAALSRANFLTGELRANGIPARQVVGVAFGDGERMFDAQQTHAWVEAYVPSSGWITLDPSFQQHGAYFGVADAQRIALGLRGFDPNFPPENAANYTVSYGDQEVPSVPSMQPSVKATKYMILPGIALGVVSVDMPSGVIVDNAGVRVGENAAVHPLGSVAPLQKVRLRSLELLGSAFSGESVIYGIFPNAQVGEGSQEIAKVSSNVSYLPMLALVALGGLLLGAKFAIRAIKSGRGGAASINRNSESVAAKDSLVVSTDLNGDSIEALDMLPLDEFDDDAASESTETKQPSTTDMPVDTPAMQPTTTLTDEKPRLSALRDMPIEHAQRADPNTVQREIRRRRPPLIQ